MSVRTRLGLPAVPAAQGLADPKQTRPGGSGRQNPCGYTPGVWGAPPGGRRGRGGPPGGPPGPGGVHFRGYLITLPVGTEWNFGFFGIFGPPRGIPPQNGPPGGPPKTPLFHSIWYSVGAQKPPKWRFPGGRPRTPSGPPRGPPGPPGPGRGARGAPRGAPRGPPRGGPPGAPRDPLRDPLQDPRRDPLGHPPPTGGDITASGRSENHQDRRTSEGTGDRETRSVARSDRRSPRQQKEG